MQKMKTHFFTVINKISPFNKHGFFEHNFLISAVARSLPLFLQIQMISIKIGSEEN